MSTQMTGFLPPFRQPQSRLLHLRLHPVPMAKERRTHLLLVFMVMPLHWVFHSIRKPRLLLKSSDLPTSLITWGVKRQSRASSVSSGALSPSAVPSQSGL